MQDAALTGRLVSVAEASLAIRQGQCLSIAGDERLLRLLPRGQWIGGTCPYFLGQDGGETTKEKLFITTIPTFTDAPIIKLCDESDLENIGLRAPLHGFTMMIIPGFTAIHTFFARYAPHIKDIFMQPLVGWVSGFHLDDTTASAKVINGQTLQMDAQRAVVIHVPLPSYKFARVGMVNVFKKGTGPVIQPRETGFTIRNCMIDGKMSILSNYISRHKIDTRLPLVANYNGVSVNASIKEVRTADGAVDFYAPLFPDCEYTFAAPVDDYITHFNQIMPVEALDAHWACNCVLNYQYLGLEGKKVNSVNCPMVFGEIAYQLVNQTMVYLIVE